MYLNKTINPLLGNNPSYLFGMDNVSIKKGEIYINKKKGFNCSYDVKNIRKWPLGKFILDNLKSKSNDVFFILFNRNYLFTIINYKL